MAGLDRVGLRYGRLTVVEFFGGVGDQRSWLTICDCGALKPVKQHGMIGGRIRSCGCLQKESASALGRSKRKHGHFGTKTYNSWASMWQRVRGNCKASSRYYTGVLICDRWKSFENFLSDMGERPPGKTLDRFPDCAGNYEPNNCRWATHHEQRVNQRRMK